MSCMTAQAACFPCLTPSQARSISCALTDMLRPGGGMERPRNCVPLYARHSDKLKEKEMKQVKMADSSRDTAYSELCHVLTAVGIQDESLFLSRLVLLMAETIGDLP